MDEPLVTYQATDFAAPGKECDLVMKGGVTSGLVYPYAILEMARVYRFRSIGGTSAGAIAAAFAAAAEYSRSMRNDPAGFLRMQAHCEDLARLLPGLFQPAPQLAGAMAFLLRAQQDMRKRAIAWSALLVFWPVVIAGGAVGAALAVLLQGGALAALLGGIIGVAVALVLLVRHTARQLVEHKFGLCSGLTQPGASQPALTDWLHRALQDIAFADPEHATPLTFRHLEEVGAGIEPIELRMITTNLSMRRPHTLPTLGLRTLIDPDTWRSLFPEAVVQHIVDRTEPAQHYPNLREFPAPADLPVVVAARMSLSFPILFCAVPLWTRDLASSFLARHTGGDGTVRLRQVWCVDGGISSNFPIHMFDALLPSRPTFALSLDGLPPGADENGDRIKIAKKANENANLPVHEVDSLLDFAGGILDAAKDWQDNLLSGMPGQRERIARVLLSSSEGGLNLTMTATKSRLLMGYGREVGQRFAAGALDFDEHRWRRALVAYEGLERTIAATDTTWTGKGFGKWLGAYMANPGSYRDVGKGDRVSIRSRLNRFAALAGAFAPAIKRADDKLPRPRGKLRIGPDL